MKLRRMWASESPSRWTATLAVTALLAACSSEVGEPQTMNPGAMGTAMPAAPGQMVTVNGVTGTVDANGNVVDANGNVVGMVDVNGNVVDPSGNVVMPATPAAPGTPTPATPGATTPTPATPGATTPPPDPGQTPPVPIATGCEPGVPGTSQLPRLSNAQYNRTISDLLGTNAPGLLAIEQVGPITKSIWDGYRLSADAVASAVMADATLKGNFMKCTPMGDGAACLSETIADFGRRAFRRPLTPEEVAGFESLVAQRNEITATGSVDEIAEVILATFLKSPSFLQRPEIAQNPDGTGNFKLTSHEVASRLSYMLWGTMPDEALDTAADADALQTKDQVLMQAQRMVADPKAKDVAAEFHRQYLHLTGGSRWDSARKDASFAMFTPEVVPDMINETEMLFDSVFASGGSFQDLLTTQKAYITARTAPLYGLDPAMYGDTPTEVDLPDPNRAGFLTRVGFLAAYSAQTRTSPILRGAFITKEVLGIDPGSPDPEAANTPLPSNPELDTNRKRVEEQTSPTACAGCHTPFVNPPGFVLEAFDTAGVAQAMERDTGTAINTVADVRLTAASDPVTINSPAELMAAIATSPAAQEFYAKRWVGYAYGRPDLTGPDYCAAEALSANVAGGNYSIQNLLTDLTQTDHFLTRAVTQ